MKSTLKYCGLNFGNELETKDLKTLCFTDHKVRRDKNFLINSGPFYEIIVYNDLKQFEIKSSLSEDLENIVNYNDIIKQVICSENSIYLLFYNGKISQYNVKSKVLAEINISLKNPQEMIVQISSTLKSLYAISNKNNLYEILPQMSLIHEFQTHQRVKKIQSGLEHTLILTNNGDIYAFGCCLRGQTGLGKMSVNDPITLLEALSGIKIVDIGCSAFCSFAVSSFGDVYSFGWNTNGQLGIKKEINRCKQVYTLPQIVDLEIECNEVNNVYCGYKHTILRTVKNKIFASGLNNYGQLGIGSTDNEFDVFKEIPIEDIDEKTVVSCGYWKTYIINYNTDS